MKVGSKGRYAVVAILDVAVHGQTSAVSLADVAARQSISLSYLEQLFAQLRRAGVVVSSRGPGGGYRLARSAGETSIRAIFEAVDEGAGEAEAGPGDGLAASLWQALSSSIAGFLGGVTVADVIAGRVAAPAAPANLSRAAE